MSALIARAETRGPEAGFGERIAENQRRVFQIAYSILGNAADAEDVAQEAFLRAYQKFGSLREAEKFRGWVNRIVFRLALNRQRGHRRRLTRDTAWQMTETRAQHKNTRSRALRGHSSRDGQLRPGTIEPPPYSVRHSRPTPSLHPSVF